MYTKIFASNLLKNFNSLVANHISFHTNPLCFAGHSKWQNIRHIKALKDAQKSDLFTKFSRQIRLAVVEGGSADTKLNPQLSTIIEHAIRQNMPKAIINKILTSFDKRDPKAELKQGIIELKMRNKNVFVLLTLVTENLHRTKAEVNTALKKTGIMTFAMCKHMFTEKGIVTTKLLAGDCIDDAMEHAIEAGAEDVTLIDRGDVYIQFITEPHQLDNVKKCLDEKGYDIDSYEKIFTPHLTAQLTETEHEYYEAFKERVLRVAGVDNIHDNIEYVYE